MFVFNFDVTCMACGTADQLGVCETRLCGSCGADISTEGKTVRETLVAAYGDDWTGSISHIADVVNTYRTDHTDWLVFRLAQANDVHGYDDTMSVSNYRVLSDQWSGNAAFEAAYRGPWSNVDAIALSLDDVAPCDVVDVLDALNGYPVLDDDVFSTVEQEMITEHWNSYGRIDALSAVADALGVDGRDCLTEYAAEVVDALTFGGYIGDEYPTVIDVSAVEFHTADVAAWVKDNVPSLHGVITLRRWSEDDGLAVDTAIDSWVTAETV